MVDDEMKFVEAHGEIGGSGKDDLQGSRSAFRKLSEDELPTCLACEVTALVWSVICGNALDIKF